MIDGRSVDTSEYRAAAVISSLCSEYGTDGLIIIGDSSVPGCAFGMEFFNPDGTSGMMCGNGGRCCVAFAAELGIINDECEFEAPDGIHRAWINGSTVRLSMSEPSELFRVLDGWFINTGARHFVKFVLDVKSVDVGVEGRILRNHPAFAPEGANVDFVQRNPDGSLSIRTFEKGVERETLACGTGITAAALVSLHIDGTTPNPVTIHATEADLFVEKTPSGIFLTGPAIRI